MNSCYLDIKNCNIIYIIFYIHYIICDICAFVWVDINTYLSFLVFHYILDPFIFCIQKKNYKATKDNSDIISIKVTVEGKDICRWKRYSDTY